MIHTDEFRKNYLSAKTKTSECNLEMSLIKRSCINNIFPLILEDLTNIWKLNYFSLLNVKQHTYSMI